MSVGRFTMRGRVFQGLVFAPFALAGGGAAVPITDPSQSGWITRIADRLSISPKAQRVSISSTQQRVWVARSNNE